MYTLLYNHVIFNIATEDLKLYAELFVCDNQFPSNWYILNIAARTNSVIDTAWPNVELYLEIDLREISQFTTSQIQLH